MQRLAKKVIIIHNEWLKERKFIIDKIYFLISKSIIFEFDFEFEIIAH